MPIQRSTLHWLTMSMTKTTRKFCFAVFRFVCFASLCFVLRPFISLRLVLLRSLKIGVSLSSATVLLVAMLRTKTLRDHRPLTMRTTSRRGLTVPPREVFASDCSIERKQEQRDPNKKSPTTDLPREAVPNTESTRKASL